YYSKAGIALPVKEVGGKVVTATDRVFPNLALNNYLGVFAGLSFIIGLTAATFSSADSVLTTLTTSAYIDLFEIDKKNTLTEIQKKYLRTGIHIIFAIILLICILLFSAWNNSAIIDTILMVAGYTYGPLLGLFTFGLFTKRKIKDSMVPIVCVAAPVITYLLNNYLASNTIFKIGPELIIYNGAISFIMLLLITDKKPKNLI
ncbi:MAG: sodium:solute symporter family transporter, partial [Bacteroidota bacterium]